MFHFIPVAESTLSVIVKHAWLTQCASSMTKRSRTPRRYRLFNTDRSFSLALICDNKRNTLSYQSVTHNYNHRPCTHMHYHCSSQDKTNY